MKSKQLITLLIALGVLLVLALLARSCKNSSTGKKGKTTGNRATVFPDLDVNAITKVTITDGDGTVNVEKGESGWTLAERDGYRADYSRLSGILKSIGKLKISQSIPVADSALGKVGLLLPGVEGATPEQTATKVDMIGEGGVDLGTLLLGKQPSSSGDSAAAGRIVRASTDEGKAWVVSENFNNLSTTVADWVSKDFIKVTGIQSIKLDRPNGAESWQASRDSIEGSFVVDAPGAGKETDPSKVSSLNYLLSSPSFQDLVSKDEAAALDFSKGATKASLKTFDGFTYDFEILPQATPPAAPGQPASPPKGYYVKVSVDASLAEVRDAVEGEDEQAKTAADEAFAMVLKTRQEKLASEQLLEGHVYKVSEYTFTSLLKSKADLVKDVEPETPASGPGADSVPGNAAGPSGQGLPQGIPFAPPASVTSPVVSLENATKEAGSKAKQAAQGVAAKVGEGGKKAADAAKKGAGKAKNAAAEVGNAAKGAAAKSGEKAAAGAKKAGGAAKKGAEAVGGAAKKAGAAAGDAAKGAGKGAKAAGDAAGKAGKGAMNLLKKAGNAAAGGAKKVGGAAAEGAKAAGGAAKTGTGTVGNGVKKAAEVVKDAVTE